MEEEEKANTGGQTDSEENYTDVTETDTESEED